MRPGSSGPQIWHGADSDGDNALMSSIRIVSYNVHGLRDDRAAVAEVLRELRPDVVCLQEAPRRGPWRGRMDALARATDLLYVAGGGTTGGTAILTSIRVDVHSSSEHLLPRTWGLTRRGATLARLSVGGRELTVSAIHLGLDPAERARHATTLLGLVRLEHAPAMAIVGDINETDRSATWRRLAAGYVDAGATDPTPTFSTSSPRRRIDAAFIAGAADVIGYHVVDSAAVRAASDHRPVVVDLTLTAGPSR